MRKILAFTMLMILFITAGWAQPTPSTPPSPESLGLQAPQATASTASVPSSESGQMVSTTATAAQAAAPSAYATTSATANMVVPQGIAAPNYFYIPYSPSTTASCYYGQWVPMWLDVRGNGPLYTYEWYPNGRLVSQYMANIPYPSWQKMWFNGDAPGWHTLQYYCNGWSNYVYVYVYGGTTPQPQPPTTCTAKITVSSPYAKGFSVYVDGVYKGGDGQNGDYLDGYYTFNVPGNQYHTIKVYHQGGVYQQSKTYYCGSTYTITLNSAPPSAGSPPSGPSEPVYPMNPIVIPGTPSQLPAEQPSVSQPIVIPNPPSVSQPIANQPTATPY